MGMHYLFFFFFLLCAQVARSDESTWTAPPARGQLELDQTLIPRGKGFLFVPAMTSPLNEPSYLVLQGKREIATANPGTGVLLDPGYYQILIGSGSVDQMMSRTVEVVEGHTTLIKPFWAGLVINVIDENRTPIDESYELFEEERQENYGIGFGIEEERGEAVKTWLLPPGLYDVLKVGDNISTIRKFTIRLLPGELVERNLVVDTKTKEFIGFYSSLKRPGLAIQQGSRIWKSQWQLSAATLFNTTQRTAGEDRSSISLSAQIYNRSTYSAARHYASLRLILEEGFAKESGDPIDKSIDEFEFRATYIYHLSRSIGPYLRGVVNTKIFATEVRYDQPQVLFLLDAENDTTGVQRGIRKFTLSPSFSPLYLRQGFGLNAQLYRSFPLNLNLRVGLGARQTYATDAYDLSQDRTSVRRLRNAASTGLEALLIIDARPTRFALFDSEFDILMPSSNSKAWEFNWENRLRLALSRFVNLDLVVEFKKEKPLRRLQARQQVLLRLTYLL